MKFRYVAFDPERHGRKALEDHLRRLFEMLLVRTAGDVEKALEWLAHIAKTHGWFDGGYDIEDFKKQLTKQGEIRTIDTSGRFGLTGKGERLMRRGALDRVFGALSAGGEGAHRTPHSGGGAEETDETRPWTFGDAVEDIAWTPTLCNALGRTGGGQLTLREEDLEVREREHHTGCATVLLVDVSHSMILYGEDRMAPAREVALALLELITTRFRKDTLDLVLFGDDAIRVPLDRIPYMQAGPYHTNTKAGLAMAQDLLRGRRHVNKRIFMITDGKPSAIWKDGGIFKNPFGLDEEIVNRTLDEAVRCRRAGISVTTFMVARDPLLVEFIEEFTELNRGRAYFTGTEGLSEALFVDYVRNRRSSF